MVAGEFAAEGKVQEVDKFLWEGKDPCDLGR